MDLLVRIIPYIGRSDVGEAAERIEAFLGLYSELPYRRSSPTDPGPAVVLDQIVKLCMLQLSLTSRVRPRRGEVLTRDINFTGKSRLLRIVLGEPLLIQRVDAEGDAEGTRSYGGGVQRGGR